MQLIDEVISHINYLGGSRWGDVIAQALYSACDLMGDMPAPNLLTMSCRLDSTGRQLIIRLIEISQEPDYSNDDQAATIAYLEERYGEFTIEQWKKGNCA